MDIKSLINSIKVSNDIAVLNIYGDIASSEWDKWSEDDVYPLFVSEFLQKNNYKELHVHINSGGGSAFAGIAIYNLLKARNGKTIVYVDALAASAASIIALAGDEIIMPSGSMLMIHEPWNMAVGNSTELRKVADTLDEICKTMIDIYKEHLINDNVNIDELLKAETWLNGADCKDLFENVIIDEGSKACACIKGDSMMHYKLPDGLIVNTQTQFRNKMLMEIEIEEML